MADHWPSYVSRALRRVAVVALSVLGCTSTPDAATCDPALTLPAGFCAHVYADKLGAIRHLAVAPNGDVYIARWSTTSAPGGLVALRDTDHDGRVDQTTVFENAGGSGLALSPDALYMATWTEVLRYPFRGGLLAPGTRPDTIVGGLPQSGHAARSMALDASGGLLLNVGAPSNSCQTRDKGVGALGRDPCPELDAFAGIWRFDARRPHQRQADGERVVRGIRHMVALTAHPATGELYGVQHGRDDLHENFPALYDREAGEQSAMEELFLLRPGRDYGWPYCYYDARRRQKILAPEYGGDGRIVGRCAAVEAPLFAFPAHWAPDGLLFYRGRMFPERYREGAFVAFHGGWYRRPPANGFNVVFLPFFGGRPDTAYAIFADGFAGDDRHPRDAPHRPVGLAEGPDGALFISDDAGGRVWRVTYAPPRAGARAHSMRR